MSEVRAWLIETLFWSIKFLDQGEDRMDEERENAEEGSDGVYESDGRESISASSYNAEAGLPSAEREPIPESSGSVRLLSDIDDDAGVFPKLRIKSCLASKGTCMYGTVAARRGWDGPASGSIEELSAEPRWVLEFI